jgi:hypothetical protein
VNNTEIPFKENIKGYHRESRFDSVAIASKNARVKTMEEYIAKANEIIKLLSGGVSKLAKNIDAPDTIWGMLGQCHHLERISLESGQYLIAYLTSKISSLLIQIATANPAEGKRHLIFLKDFFGSLKRAVDQAAKKREYLIEIKKFERFDELTKKYLRWRERI